MDRFTIITIIACLILIGFTLLLSKISKNKSIKYIPFITILIIGLGCIIKASISKQGLEDLGYIILSLINILASLCSLITALIIDTLNQKKRINTPKNKKKSSHKRKK